MVCAQAPGVTHPPWPRTKYVVVVVGLTEKIPVVFEATEVPPQLPAYRCQAVAEFSVPVAVMLVLVPEQMVLCEAVRAGTVGALHGRV